MKVLVIIGAVFGLVACGDQFATSELGEQGLGCDCSGDAGYQLTGPKPHGVDAQAEAEVKCAKSCGLNLRSAEEWINPICARFPTSKICVEGPRGAEEWVNPICARFPTAKICVEQPRGAEEYGKHCGSICARYPESRYCVENNCP